MKKHFILVYGIGVPDAIHVVQSNIYFVDTKPYYDFINKYGLEDDYKEFTYKELTECEF